METRHRQTMTSGQSDILDPLTPWAWALAIVTTIHIICVFFFWRAVIFREGTDLGNYFAWAILAIFPLEVGVAYFIQRRMKQQGHTLLGRVASDRRKLDSEPACRRLVDRSIRSALVRSGQGEHDRLSAPNLSCAFRWRAAIVAWRRFRQTFAGLVGPHSDVELADIKVISGAPRRARAPSTWEVATRARRAPGRSAR